MARDDDVDVDRPVPIRHIPGKRRRRGREPALVHAFLPLRPVVVRASGNALLDGRLAALLVRDDGEQVIGTGDDAGVAQARIVHA